MVSLSLILEHLARARSELTLESEPLNACCCSREPDEHSDLDEDLASAAARQDARAVCTHERRVSRLAHFRLNESLALPS